MPIAVIEAKDNNHSVGAGMQQALAYATTLDVPYVFSSNGDGFLFHDRTGQSPQMETTLSLSEFPSPEELWNRYLLWKNFSDAGKTLVSSPNHQETAEKSPRYYQQIAINRKNLYGLQYYLATLENRTCEACAVFGRPKHSR
jgi:type I restriction enzyme R subunit